MILSTRRKGCIYVISSALQIDHSPSNCTVYINEHLLDCWIVKIYLNDGVLTQQQRLISHFKQWIQISEISLVPYIFLNKSRLKKIACHAEYGVTNKNLYIRADIVLNIWFNEYCEQYLYNNILVMFSDLIAKPLYRLRHLTDFI